MKKLYFILLAGATIAAHSQTIEFPDVYFKNKLLAASPENTIAKDLSGNYITIDQNDDGEIQVSEAEQIGELSVYSSHIADFSGIQYFANLVSLDCTNNGRFGVGNIPDNSISLDLTLLSNLKELTSIGNNLYLGLSSFTNLEHLELYHSLNAGGDLDFTAFHNLKYLGVGRTNTYALHIDGLAALEYLDISYDDFTQLDVSQFSNLKSINCRYAALTSLDVSNLPNLEEIDGINSALAALHVNGCTALRTIYCNDTSISSLDAGNLPQLQQLLMEGCALNFLNISGCGNLETARLSYNQLTQLDANNLLSLAVLECRENQLVSLDVSNSSAITELDCGSNQLTTLDCSSLSNLQSLTCIYNNLSSLYIKNGSIESYLSFNGNPDLTYICADAAQVADVQLQANTNCVVDSSCSLNATAFKQAGDVDIAPNPATTFLSLNLKPSVKILGISIFNILGQSVMEISNTGATQAVDVSNLKTGSYFIKVNTDSGLYHSRFIKN